MNTAELFEIANNNFFIYFFRKIRKYMDVGYKRATSFLKRGSLIEYVFNNERMIGIILDIKWNKRYSLSEITIIKHNIHETYIKDVTKIYIF